MDADPALHATGPDMPRLVATDADYTLSLDEVAQRYTEAGHSRTLRSLQRYCANGHLEAQKIATALGDKYLVTPQSVARHIAQIQELVALDTVVAGRDLPRPDATPVAHLLNRKTSHAAPRQAATGEETSRHVAQLEREVEQAKDERDFLREQIDRKDKTIEALIERDRETNFLIRGLQNLIPRLTSARHEPSGPHQEASI